MTNKSPKPHNSKKVKYAIQRNISKASAIPNFGF